MSVGESSVHPVRTTAREKSKNGRFIHGAMSSLVRGRPLGLIAVVGHPMRSPVSTGARADVAFKGLHTRVLDQAKKAIGHKPPAPMELAKRAPARDVAGAVGLDDRMWADVGQSRRRHRSRRGCPVRRNAPN
jgi:hypothetical protein